jgi:hypothetical protein
MGLLSNIPGLATHQVEVPSPVFDRARAGRLVCDMIALIGSYFPGEALVWLSVNRPDVQRYIRQALDEVDAAVNAGDPGRFTRALEDCAKFHRRAFEIFEQRPQEVVRQAEMFQGAA